MRLGVSSSVCQDASAIFSWGLTSPGPPALRGASRGPTSLFRPLGHRLRRSRSAPPALLLDLEPKGDNKARPSGPRAARVAEGACSVRGGPGAAGASARGGVSGGSSTAAPRPPRAPARTPGRGPARPLRPPRRCRQASPLRSGPFPRGIKSALWGGLGGRLNGPCRISFPRQLGPHWCLA